MVASYGLGSAPISSVTKILEAITAQQEQRAAAGGSGAAPQEDTGVCLLGGGGGFVGGPGAGAST
jgi:hypothetical protein